VYRELEVLMAIDGTMTVDEIENSIGPSGDELDDLLDGLEKKGAVRRERGEVEKLKERP
jgi:DNA-binding MarR family transcriptional regulator